jgi:hypothetical protein
MRNTILIAVVSLIFLSCSKDKFSSTPQLTYKSVNTDRLSPNQVIQFSLSFTDAEGDVIDTMYVQKVSLNCAASNFFERVAIPDFTTNKNLKADVLVSYANGINNPPYTTVASRCSFNDTCYFRFMLKDKANNKSDTVRSETIVIYK